MQKTGSSRSSDHKAHRTFFSPGGKLERNQEYIVASYVGENSWGYGYYADGIKDATKKFNSIMADYTK
jgi:hypothetical protein